jgi:hypothetical protein
VWPRTAVYFHASAIISCRAVVPFDARVAAGHRQNGDRKKQSSASRSALWPTRGHREAKNAGNASALASLRAARKKARLSAFFPPLALALAVMPERNEQEQEQEQE